MRKKLFLTAAVAGLLLASGTMAGAAPGTDGRTESAPTASVSLEAAGKDTQASGAVALEATCEFPVNATNTHLQTKTVTSSTARFYTSTVWTDLECGTLTVTVPRGRRAGVVVRTDAEVTCTGPAVDATQWCLGRVLVNNTEAYPRATEADGSFAWAQSSPDAGAWESNSFTRSLSVSCPASTTPLPPCSWTVRVQVRNHTTGLNSRVDDSTVEAQLTYV